MHDRQNTGLSVRRGLNAPRVYPSLGRYEDLLDIEKVDVVNVEQREIVSAENDMFVPIQLLYGTDNDELPGTVYLLHKEFEYDAKKRRRWKGTIETRYINTENNSLYDDHHQYLFLFCVLDHIYILKMEHLLYYFYYLL